jgi:glycosyltransferase involved in cell wall biosynthesis
MKNPKFSIVIPVRNGAETIANTIETCLNQDYENYEVVIADNASDDSTQEIVKGFTSSKIKYFRNEVATSMTANWNWALSLTSGDWITFLGADDGIRSNTLAKIANCVGKEKIQAVSWSQAIYTWPTLMDPSKANRLSIPPLTSRTKLCNSSEIIDSAKLGLSFPYGTSIYYGAISRKLVNKALRTGTIFQGRSPDIYSALLFSGLTKKYLYIEDALTITGFSKNSNGLSHFSSSRKNIKIATEFKKLNYVEKISIHDELPDIEVVSVVTWDALLKVRDRLSDERFNIGISLEKRLELFLKQMFQKGSAREIQLSILSEYAEKHSVSFSGDDSVPAQVPEFIPLNGHVSKLGLLYVVNTTIFGIVNVRDSANFIDTVSSVYDLLVMAQDDLESRVKAYEAEIVRLNLELAKHGGHEFN